MGEPVQVSVSAVDPVLEAGVASALHRCPDLRVTERESAAVVVVVVDAVDAAVLDGVRTIRGGPQPPEVVLVATELDLAGSLHAVAAGTRGLLRRREADADRLARTVLAAAYGDCTLPPDLLDRLTDAAPARSVATQLADGGLSDRERAVLALIADGRETQEIARSLSYSVRTVTSVVHDITRRYRLRNRAHAVAYSVRAGLL